MALYPCDRYETSNDIDPHPLHRYPSPRCHLWCLFDQRRWTIIDWYTQWSTSSLTRKATGYNSWRVTTQTVCFAIYSLWVHCPDQGRLVDGGLGACETPVALTPFCIFRFKTSLSAFVNSQMTQNAPPFLISDWLDNSRTRASVRLGYITNYPSCLL